MSLSRSQPSSCQSFVLAVRVQPRSSKEAVAGISEGVVRIRLTAPPVEGKANEALLKFLSKKLGVSKGALELVAGDHGRNKLIRIAGLSCEEIHARLGVASPS
jgi:uncharacterized protein (TIGR00251 family)